MDKRRPRHDRLLGRRDAAGDFQNLTDRHPGERRGAGVAGKAGLRKDLQTPRRRGDRLRRGQRQRHLRPGDPSAQKRGIFRPRGGCCGGGGALSRDRGGRLPEPRRHGGGAERDEDCVYLPVPSSPLRARSSPQDGKRPRNRLEMRLLQRLLFVPGTPVRLQKEERV